jgi:hypothetical protein
LLGPVHREKTGRKWLRWEMITERKRKRFHKKSYP